MPAAFAIFAHPDDIEFVAAGTLLQLKDLGWEIHYANLANGCCGSTETDRSTTAAIRLAESRRAAEQLGAIHYPPICDDLEIEYNRSNLRIVAGMIRQAKPSIVLTHAPSDYMEDHMETCRLVVSAAFARGIPNFPSDPPLHAIDGDVAIYHAQPHGNRTPLGEVVVPTVAIPIDHVMARKIAMLECHQSQQKWLKSSQGMNSYVASMLELGREVASLAGAPSTYAEGWRRHSHLGFSIPSFDPLGTALIPHCADAANA